MEEFSNENVENNETLPENETQPTLEENSITALVGGVMKEQDIKKISAKQRAVKIGVQVGLYLFLGIMALIIIFPFYWMIISSLKTPEEYRATIPPLFPQTFESRYVSGVVAGMKGDEICQAFIEGSVHLQVFNKVLIKQLH